MGFRHLNEMGFLSSSTRLRFFQIKSTGAVDHRQAKLLQIFIIVLSSVALAQAMLDFFLSPQALRPISVGLMAFTPVWGFVCLAILRNGRLRLAVHSYFIVFNLIFLVLSHFDNTVEAPHPLTLASIIAVAFIHSIRASAGYAIALIVLAAFSAFSQGWVNPGSLATFVITALGVSAAAWLLANTWQNHAQPGEKKGDQTAPKEESAVSPEKIGLPPKTLERVAELSALYRLSNVLSLAPSLKDIFNGARREIMSLVEATGMSISLIIPDGDKLHWIYGFENEREVDLSAVPLLSVDEGFSGYVFRMREVLHVSSQMDELYKKLHSFTVGEDFGAWLGLPMIVANEAIGVLAVENHTPFSERAIELLTSAAGSIAIAIHNLIQFEAVQNALTAQSEHHIQLQAAAEIAAATTSILDINTLTQKAVNLIKERFALYYVGLFLIDQATNCAILQAGTGKAGRAQLEARHQLEVGGRSLIGGATADGKPRITQDVLTDEEWRANPFLPQTRSELAMPLRVRGHISGALTIQSVTPHAFGPALISTLQTMSDQLAIAIENVQLLTDAEARAQRQQKLNQISSQMYRSIDVNEIVRIGLQSLSDLFENAPVELLLGQPINGREDE